MIEQMLLLLLRGGREELYSSSEALAESSSLHPHSSPLLAHARLVEQ